MYSCPCTFSGSLLPYTRWIFYPGALFSLCISVNPACYPENRALKGLLDRPSMDWAVYLSATTVNFSLVCHLLTTEKAHWVGGLLARADYLEFCQPVAKLSVAWNWPWWNYSNHRNHQKLQTRASPTPQSQFASTPPVLDFFESLRRTRIVPHMCVHAQLCLILRPCEL